MIFEYVNYFKPHFKKTVLNQQRQKFSISKYKLILYDQNTSGIQCSETSNIPLYSTFNIQRSDLPNNEPEKLYHQKLPLKKIKFDNVLTLANEYVPKNDLVIFIKTSNVLTKMMLKMK